MNYKEQKYTNRILKFKIYAMALQKCTLLGKQHQWSPFAIAQTKQARGLASLSRATDTLSTLLAQQVRELNARQKAAKKEGASGAGTMKDLKEATAVLKDLAGVAKTLNDQGAQAEGAECGVVLLPTVEEEP